MDRSDTSTLSPARFVPQRFGRPARTISGQHSTHPWTRTRNAWYLKQVLGFAVRKIFPWAALFACNFVGRFAWDMLSPTTDFHMRSQITTYTSIALLVAVGFWTAWHSGSLLSGAAAGLVTVATASLLSMTGNVVLVAFWHNAAAMRAISASGGLDEAFLLPLILIVPGSILGGIGGLVGAGAKFLARMS